MRKPNSTQFPRRDGGRKPRRIIRVLTEGRVTEPSYIDMLARRYRDVRISRKDTGVVPLTLVQLAREYQKQNKKRNPDYDEIWCIFDVDQHPNIAQAIQEARDSGINVAISNPCFELWLVLHYQDQTGPIHRHAIQSLSKKLGITDGKRITAKAQGELLTRLDVARSRAKKLTKMHKGNNPNNPKSWSWKNPNSQVWKFVDRLALFSEVGNG